MSRSRRQRTGLWIVTLSNGKSSRLVAKTERHALKRALVWCQDQGSDVTVIGLHEVI